MTANDIGRLAYLLVLLIAVGGFLVIEFRARAGSTLRQLAAWGLIFVGAIAAAALWQDMQERSAPLMEVTDSGRRLEVPLDPAGHARVTAEVNGTKVDFVIDTGASMLALGARDARRIGIDPALLVYTGQARTANGLTGIAPVTLKTLTLGGITDENVPAMVIEGQTDQSLMGMTYLRRFARVSIEGNHLILER
ncbi:TIGR02281 family clan AA aspartic protease [Paracoccus suum]|uniref:TIGR02281 family clan AA aspartic protease n=1 Tax=Paracoccus suum TaxID=2259340 RepID=A0A344PGG7_9RHOB|nr:TIGR02281 family clan AA aspartic protease [Paracoccus suum]AXC48472.1 TIGR02281 family clan AA aspartic protease [Paracoccus suum]